MSKLFLQFIYGFAAQHKLAGGAENRNTPGHPNNPVTEFKNRKIYHVNKFRVIWIEYPFFKSGIRVGYGPHFLAIQVAGIWFIAKLHFWRAKSRRGWARRHQNCVLCGSDKGRVRLNEYRLGWIRALEILYGLAHIKPPTPPVFINRNYYYYPHRLIYNN